MEAGLCIGGGVMSDLKGAVLGLEGLDEEKVICDDCSSCQNTPRWQRHWQLVLLLLKQ